MDWRPSAKTQLLLKQLGYTADHITKTLNSYNQEALSPNDRDFLQEVTFSMEAPADKYHHLVELALLPTTWKPTEALWKKLVDDGYCESLLHQYRDQFILQAREQKRTYQNPDIPFEGFCRRRARTRPQPLPNDWVPSRQVIDALVGLNRCDMQQLLGAIARFIERYQYRLSTDWDATFTRYIYSLENWYPEKNNRVSELE